MNLPDRKHPPRQKFPLTQLLLTIITWALFLAFLLWLAKTW